MLRIIQNNSAAGAKHYYSTSDYYTQGQELAGTWHGQGAELLGLSGEVDKQSWDRLCDNLHPQTGGKLMPRTRAERRIGYDLNFHAPKSVSVLYSFTQDERILEAFRAAVGETMSDLEAEMQTRVRKGGQDADRTTGNMVWGEFVHFTARPVDGVPDPHLHAHCFAFNTTFDPDEGRWKAGQFARIKHDAPYFEAAFHSRLSHNLASLGLEIEQTRTGWELAGVPRSVLRAFSRRTAQIEHEAQAKGITSASEKDKLGAKTRQKKADHLSPSDLRAAWKDRISESEHAAVVKLATRKDTPAHVTHEREDVIPQQVAPTVVEKVATGPSLTVQPITPTQREAAAWAVSMAMDHCFERSAVVPERAILARAMKFGVGRTTIQAVHDAVARSHLVWREMGGERMVTTREVLAEEQAMLDFARSGRGTCAPLNSAAVYTPESPRSVSPSGITLNDEQHRAMRHVLTSPDRVMLIRGAAGTGKTTLMQATIASIEQGGKRVGVFAPSAAASHGVLKDAGFHHATTVAMLLASRDAQERVRDGVIWIDEAGLLGSKATKQVFDLAKELNARVILSGDKRQHGSVARGGVLHLLEREAGIMPAELRQIRRQDGAYKQAVMVLSEGHTAEGFSRLDELGWIRQLPDDNQRYVTLANAYVEQASKPGHTLVVCPTHGEAASVTHAIREQLQSLGTLSKDEHVITRLVNRQLTEAERRDSTSYAPGDVLVFHQHAPGIRKGSHVTLRAGMSAPIQYADRFSVYRPTTIALAVGDRVRITKNRSPRRDGHGPGNKRLNNGDIFTVEGFTKDGDLRLSNGATVSRDYGHLDYGYVVTSHASQGKSVERVLIAQSAESLRASSREQFYVSVSRGRQQALVFTDDKQALLEAVKQTDPRMTATELVMMRVPQRTAASRSQRVTRQPGPVTRSAARAGTPRSPGTLTPPQRQREAHVYER
jgi:conjugative relaxase-like TrwC/TraI family protein